MTNPIISIIVPSYNMEKYLDRGLKSLIISDSLLSCVEVIVVNDGSKDKTLEIARKYEKEYRKTFVVVDKENGNYGSCVNAGLKIAKGVFIKIMDADDYFVTTNFEKMVAKLIESEALKENVELFFFDWRYVDDNDAVIQTLSFDIPQNVALNIRDSSEIKYFHNIQHHAIAYRTSFLRKNQYVQSEGISYSDTEWIYKPLLYVKRIKYHPLIVYSYFFGRSDQSMSPIQIAKGFNSMIAVEQSMLSTYLNSIGKVDIINKEIFKDRFISSIAYFYMTYLVKFPNKKTLEGIIVFDNDLKNKCSEIYCALEGLSVTRLKIKYIKAFRRNSRSLKYKIVVVYYRLRRFLRKHL